MMWQITPNCVHVGFNSVKSYRCTQIHACTSCHFNFGEIVRKNLNIGFDSCGVKITLQYFGFWSSIVLKNKEIYRKYLSWWNTTFKVSV